MTLTDYATELASRVRAEGARSPAVIAGLHLTVAGWAALGTADIDTELRWGLAATGAHTVLDTLDPLPAHRIDVLDNPDQAAAAAVADLLTAIADAFTAAAAADGPHRSAWYREAASELRDAAAALT